MVTLLVKQFGISHECTKQINDNTFTFVVGKSLIFIKSASSRTLNIEAASIDRYTVIEV